MTAGFQKIAKENQQNAASEKDGGKIKIWSQATTVRSSEAALKLKDGKYQNKVVQQLQLQKLM